MPNNPFPNPEPPELEKRVLPVGRHQPVGLLATCVLLARALCGAACGPGEKSRPTLLLITVDTLRADRLGAYGSNRELTPHFDRLAGESVVFDATYASAPFTVPSIATILTGQYPEQNALYSNESLLPDRVTTLALVLEKHGYRTGAVVSNWVLRPGGGLERGFSEYDASFSQIETVRKIPERIAARTTDDALKMLDRLREESAGPLFLWVHYQDPHGPYTPPDEFRSWVSERGIRPERQQLPFGLDNRGLGSIPQYQRIGDHAEAAYYQNGYDAEVRYTDAEIGRLLDSLRARGLYDDAVIVFAADHGEGLGEHDYWFAHGEHLFDPLVRVPVFIRIPGRPPGHRTDVTALVDLFPTILSAVGIAPPSGLPGQNLLNKEARRRSTTPYMATLEGSTVPRFAIVSDGFKYLVAVQEDIMTEQLFRLDNGREDIARHAPQRLQRMRREMRDLRARVQPIQPEQQRDFLDVDQEKLQALGYLNDP